MHEPELVSDGEISSADFQAWVQYAYLYHASFWLVSTLQQLIILFYLFVLVDVNECLTGDNDCDEMSEVCVNAEPLFTCDCKDGYQRSPESGPCDGE